MSEDVAKREKRQRYAGSAERPRRSAQLMVRITDSERRLVEQHAAMMSLSASSWARMILMREIKGGKE